MIRRPPRSTLERSSAASDVYKRQARGYAAIAERSGWSEHQLAEAMAPYWAEYDGILTDSDARSASRFTLTEEPGRWSVTQRISDPAGDGEWRLVASVDLALAETEGAPILHLDALGPLAL